MPLFDWIHSNLHDLNLDWIIGKIKNVETAEANSAASAADANAAKTAAAGSATAANNSKTAAAGSATAAAASAQTAQNLVDQLDTTIAADVETWLNTHVTPTSPIVDDTLTIQGAAADAKKTGDEITDLKTAITQAVDVLIGDSNVLPSPNATTTLNGVTFTADPSAGTVAADGTASVNTIYGFNFTLPKDGKYHLSGCPSGGSTSNYYQRINTVTGNDTGNGVDINLSADTEYMLWIVIGEGRTVDNVVFTPSLTYEGDSISSVKNIAESTPYKAKKPALFEGGMSYLTGQYYHDGSESWTKTRVRTNAVKIKQGSKIKKVSGSAYQLSICQYADYELYNYTGYLLANASVTEWVCPADGYYSITWKYQSSGNMNISNVAADWDFSEFYIIEDDRIRVHWIGTGNLDETTTATDVGDCAMVVFPDGEGLLIDAANSRNWTSVRKRIAEAGFYHIKNIIVSHFHSDHIGGLVTMVNQGAIDITGATVYLPDYEATLWAYNNGVMEEATKTWYDEAMTMFNNSGCVLVYPDTDFKPYQIGGAVLTFFNTDLSVYENVSTNYNDWSLCNYIFYGNMNICFSGDIGPIAQAHLGGSLYKANIYKADHHGWLNQTTIPASFINNVSPDVIISLDGQTHDDLLLLDTSPLIRWAEKNGVAYYRKYQNNEINMAVSENAWMFETKVKRYVLPD